MPEGVGYRPSYTNYPPVGRKGPAGSPNGSRLAPVSTSDVRKRHRIPEPGRPVPDIYSHQSNAIKPSRPFVKRGDTGDN